MLDMLEMKSMKLLQSLDILCTGVQEEKKQMNSRNPQEKRQEDGLLKELTAG